MTSGPVAPADRVQELDVLRGVALYGVFVMNMVWLGNQGIMATEQQLLSLPTAGIDFTVRALVGWLVGDKANTLFAFLFGLGFYLQLRRAESAGRDFERLYLRRLSALLAFGLFHLVFIFFWDILSIYALAGFALFALRRTGDRVLLWGGLGLALGARILFQWLAEHSGLGDWAGLADPYTEAAVLARQQLADAGDYAGLVRAMGAVTLHELLNGIVLGWMLYALGRFMLGAWTGRKGWLQRAGDYLPGFRRVMAVTLPAGLVSQGLVAIVRVYEPGGRLPDWDHWSLAAETVHLLTAPVLATGYLCAIVVGLHTPGWRRLLAPFRHAGRMALSNYVMQSFICGFVFFGVGPGLALAGRIGAAALLVVATAAFAAQVVLSHWWLARFRYGPLEWAWRGLTYGEWPPAAAGSGAP
jgi:uncharacterized protein